MSAEPLHYVVLERIGSGEGDEIRYVTEDYQKAIAHATRPGLYVECWRGKRTVPAISGAR